MAPPKDNRHTRPGPKMHQMLSRSGKQLSRNRLELIEMFGAELLSGSASKDMVIRLRAMVTAYRKNGMLPEDEKVLQPIEKELEQHA